MQMQLIVGVYMLFYDLFIRAALNLLTRGASSSSRGQSQVHYS